MEKENRQLRNEAICSSETRKLRVKNFQQTKISPNNFRKKSSLLSSNGISGNSASSDLMEPPFHNTYPLYNNSKELSDINFEKKQEALMEKLFQQPLETFNPNQDDSYEEDKNMNNVTSNINDGNNNTNKPNQNDSSSKINNNNNTVNNNGIESNDFNQLEIRPSFPRLVAPVPPVKKVSKKGVLDFTDSLSEDANDTVGTYYYFNKKYI